MVEVQERRSLSRNELKLPHLAILRSPILGSRLFTMSMKEELGETRRACFFVLDLFTSVLDFPWPTHTHLGTYSCQQLQPLTQLHRGNSTPSHLSSSYLCRGQTEPSRRHVFQRCRNTKSFAATSNRPQRETFGGERLLKEAIPRCQAIRGEIRVLRWKGEKGALPSRPMHYCGSLYRGSLLLASILEPC